MNGIADNLGCDGVAHYDGTRWTSYLRGWCVHDLDIGPDGSLWVRAGAYRLDGDPAELVHTDVIRPDAGATRE